MIFSSKAFSLVISFIVGSLTTIFLSLLKVANPMVYVVAFSISMGSCFLLSYFTLQFFVFREIEKLKRSFEKFKKNDFSNVKGKKGSKRKSSNPIETLGADMHNFAYNKQMEIQNLRKQEAFRRDFVADVAHELKTPIFAAQGFIHTLLDGGMEDQTVNRKFLKKAAKSIDGLENLVKDLIIISQIESGDVKLEFEYFNFDVLVTEIIEQLEPKARNKETTISMVTNAKEPIIIYGDSQRLGQVMTNLIDNSIKYGNLKGSIKVQLKRSSGGKKVYVTVKDDGPGMSDEHLKRIFERFYRVDKSRSRETGGTGLGLAIVKHILEAHKAKIDVQSEVGRGTKFTFVLSLPDAEKEQKN